MTFVRRPPEGINRAVAELGDTAKHVAEYDQSTAADRAAKDAERRQEREAKARSNEAGRSYEARAKAAATERESARRTELSEIHTAGQTPVAELLKEYIGALKRLSKDVPADAYIPLPFYLETQLTRPGLERKHAWNAKRCNTRAYVVPRLSVSARYQLVLTDKGIQALRSYEGVLGQSSEHRARLCNVPDGKYQRWDNPDVSGTLEDLAWMIEIMGRRCPQRLPKHAADWPSGGELDFLRLARLTGVEEEEVLSFIEKRSTDRDLVLSALRPALDQIAAAHPDLMARAARNGDDAYRTQAQLIKHLCEPFVGEDGRLPRYMNRNTAQSALWAYLDEARLDEHRGA